MRSYSPGGSQELLYGICCANTLEWHGGGKQYNPTNGLMPGALHKNYDSAKRELDSIIGGPPDLFVVLVQAVYLPVKIAISNEEEHGFIRQEVIDGELVRVE